MAVGRSQAAAAGAVAAAVWAAQEPIDQRIFGCDYSDVALLGKFLRRDSGWREPCRRICGPHPGGPAPGIWRTQPRAPEKPGRPCPHLPRSRRSPRARAPAHTGQPPPPPGEPATADAAANVILTYDAFWRN